MNTYLYDTHVHTSEVSPCAFVPAAEMVRLYKAAGYHGIIITDHYYDGYFESLGSLPWEEKLNHYLSGYRCASKEGQKAGLQVLMGLELRFQGTDEDYLVYGVDPSFLLTYPELYSMDLKSFRKFADDHDLVVIQAHPFRQWVTPAPPHLLDGVEVFNGNPRHNSHNNKAYRYAQENKLAMIAGSDAHRTEDVGRGGIILKERILSSREFAENIKRKLPMDLFTNEAVDNKV